jgi:hypothetical protein
MKTNTIINIIMKIVKTVKNNVGALDVAIGIGVAKLVNQTGSNKLHR